MANAFKDCHPTALDSIQHLLKPGVLVNQKERFAKWMSDDKSERNLIDLPGITEDGVAKLLEAGVSGVYHLLGRYVWDSDSFYPWLVDVVHLSPNSAFFIVVAFSLKMGQQPLCFDCDSDDEDCECDHKHDERDTNGDRCDCMGH